MCMGSNQGEIGNTSPQEIQTYCHHKEHRTLKTAPDTQYSVKLANFHQPPETGKRRLYLRNRDWESRLNCHSREGVKFPGILMPCKKLNVFQQEK